MKNIIDLNQDRRKLLFETAAREMKVSSVIIEKDFWVCYVLNYLFTESKYKDYFIFKGGTSLSKCYNVIERFSEDVDLILRWDKIGFSDLDVYKSRSKNQDYKFESLMNEKGGQFIQTELKNDLANNLASKIKNMHILSDDKDPLILYVAYPACFIDTYIPQVVKLELGPVAAKTPIESRSISPYCYISLNNADKSNIPVEIVTISRTFWEKLLILYTENNRPLEKKIPPRYSRHYYDVYMIFKSDYFSSIISSPELFEEVKLFKAKYYRTSWSKIEECSLKTISIAPREERTKELLSDYENMKDMIFDNRQEFKEIINGLKELESILRNL